MKNFFKNIKNYVTEHKVKTIVTVIAVMLIIVLIAVGITATKTETPKVADKKITKVETKKKAVKKEDTKKTETAKEEVKQEEEVKSTDKAESSAIKEETVNKSSKSTAKQSATGNTTSKPAAKPATKTPRWVVDRAAWTETKQVPVYDYVYVYKVYGVKSDKSTEYIGNYYSYDEACAAMDNFDRSKYVTTGYASNLEEKLIRTDTQTINHPEEGHWEY